MAAEDSKGSEAKSNTVCVLNVASVTIAADKVAIAVNGVSFQEVAYFNEPEGGLL